MLEKPTFVLLLVAIIFTGVYFWLVTPISTDFAVEPKFDWPDETANYFWIKQYAQTGELSVFEPLNLVAKNQIHPRSFNVRSDGSLVPGSFLGLILLFGTLAKIFSTKAIIYFTPVFSILACFAFYGIIKRIFSPKIALISAILLLAHPAWWYYSVTSMLPNVVFVSLLLFSIYFLLIKNKASFWEILLSAFFLGLAVSIRPSEIIWLGILFLVLLVHQREKIKITPLVLFLTIVSLTLLPTFYQQQILYGNFLTSGYSQLQPELEMESPTLQTITSLILPFGFQPKLAIANLWNHYLSRLWWLSLLAVLGLIAFFTQKSREKPEVFGYIILSGFIFGWLGIYYGSWQFTDFLTVHLNTLGLSYVRYWLPLYVLALPFVAIALLWLTNFFKNRWQNLVIVILVLIIFYPSANLVLKVKPDSILPVRERIFSYKANAKEVFGKTEIESVIITVRKDKLFFPERKVIHTFNALSLNQELIDLLPNLLEQVPVYYYALGPEPRLDFENGVSLELVDKVGQEILYKLTN